MAKFGISGEELFGNFQFLLEIEGITQDEKRSVIAGFKSVSGLSSKTEVIEWKHGNDRHVRKKPGRTNYTPIVLERGFTGSDDLYKWRTEIENGLIVRRSGSVVMLDHNGDHEIARFDFVGAWPSSWEAPGFDGSTSEMAIEKMELTVEQLQRTQ